MAFVKARRIYAKMPSGFNGSLTLKAEDGFQKGAVMNIIAAQDACQFDPIRSDIRRRVDALGRDYRELSLEEIVRRADAVRRLAVQHGFDAIRQLAGALTDAVSRDGRAAIIPAYLQSLNEAASIDSRDTTASELLMASISVRFAS